MSKELLQQALDVMLAAIKAGDWEVDGACDPDYVLEALRARLEQPEQEPVAWMYNSMGDTRFAKTLDTPGMHRDESVPLYTAPPQREWQGLTDDEKEDVLKGSKNAYDAIERIETKLKEKNHGSL